MKNGRLWPWMKHTKCENFQETLMKVYFIAGLKEIAQASGFRGATLTSLEKCSNFKRTHNFFIQIWEAIYRALLMQFTKSNNTTQILTKNVQALLQNKIAESADRLKLMASLDTLVTSFSECANRREILEVFEVTPICFLDIS